MTMFLVKRVLSSIVTLFVIITATFFLMHAVPGGPFATNEKLGQGIIKAMEAKYGLDKPLIQQYGIYLKNLVKGDLGMSIASKEGKTVNYIISQKFPVSARLGGLSVLLALILGLLMGCYAALRHEKFVDRLVMFISTLGIAVPGFIMGMLLLLLFGVALRWLKFIGLNSPLDYILPTFTLAFYPACFIARLIRSSLLDVLGQDYIRTARAKGIPAFYNSYKTCNAKCHTAGCDIPGTFTCLCFGGQLCCGAHILNTGPGLVFYTKHHIA